ncbi:hypothetical protein [Paracidovorax avenae]|uniref:hypothetical protein n=1 Tax=Paracidovorax avenae TaxID=80867 RepID=UPI000D22B15D|nr:hypothetical protein [Paracidovorax avenae]AVT12533.1 hypothetical protein C8235_06295 [Paracidovorax avenae]
MQDALILVAALSLCSFAIAKGGGHSGCSHGSSHSVSGYTRKDGTHVAPSHATNPNGTKRDNWSTKGNVNPHTGKEGTKEP